MVGRVDRRAFEFLDRGPAERHLGATGHALLLLDLVMQNLPSRARSGNIGPRSMDNMTNELANAPHQGLCLASGHCIDRIGPTEGGPGEIIGGRDGPGPLTDRSPASWRRQWSGR